jgi:hypothetical protein
MDAAQIADELVSVDRRRLFLGVPAVAAGSVWAQAAEAYEPPYVTLTIVTHYRKKGHWRRQDVLSRGRPRGCSGRLVAPWLSDFVAHVPQPNTGAR